MKRGVLANELSALYCYYHQETCKENETRLRDVLLPEVANLPFMNELVPLSTLLNSPQTLLCSQSSGGCVTN